MTTGRPPKPTALKVLQGTNRPDRVNRREPKPPAGAIKPPRWLKGRGRAEFRRVAPHLEQMGVLTVADVDALALMCDAYAEFVECRAVIAEKGATYPSNDGRERQRPEVAMAQDAWRRVQRMMTEFGRTPSSRSKLHVAAKDDPVDPFTEWERSGRGAG